MLTGRWPQDAATIEALLAERGEDMLLSELSGNDNQAREIVAKPGHGAPRSLAAKTIGA